MTEYLNTHNASILLSAANKSHYPQDDLPEVALAGRSNVGKSSFINTLLGRKKLARTSSKPGKTQLLNFYNIDDKLRFVECAWLWLCQGLQDRVGPSGAR